MKAKVHGINIRKIWLDRRKRVAFGDRNSAIKFCDLKEGDPSKDIEEITVYASYNDPDKIEALSKGEEILDSMSKAERAAVEEYFKDRG